MSTSFNGKVVEEKNRIQNECRHFKDSYEAFKTLSNKIISCKDIDENTKLECKQFTEVLNDGNIKIIFCGQVKSGKSRCIIEYLSGEVNLPSRETPATSFFTQIYWNEEPILFSKGSDGKTQQFKDFDGRNLKDELVGRVNDILDENIDTEKIFFAGTPYTFKAKNFILIDTPGLNETKGITEAFFKNLKKLNPQLIVYIYDAAPGFTTSDMTFCTKIIANARKNLRKIFLFNKYDVAFQEQVKFPDDNSDEEVGDDDYDDEEYENDDDDDDENLKNSEKYRIDFEKHLKTLKSCSQEENSLTLIGYSSKLVQHQRLKKPNTLPFLLNKHIEFLNEIQNQFNIINIETIEKMLVFTEQYLFTQFKKIYDQILSLKSKDFQRLKLEGTAKQKLLLKFDQTHAEIKILLPKSNQYELDKVIMEIIEKEKKQWVNRSSEREKFEKIANALTNYFINRYINLFSNIIQSNLEDTSFSSLTDELKRNDIVPLFSHSFCTLKLESNSQNLDLVIQKYLSDKYNKLINNLNKLPINDLPTFYNDKQWLKTHLKYDLEHVLPQIENYIKVQLSNERKQLENAIQQKTTEIHHSNQMTEQETNELIKGMMGHFRVWLLLNNNFIKTQIHNSKISEAKKTFLHCVINDSVDMNNKLHILQDSAIIYKKELLDLSNINFQNCGIIQYFLRTQYISAHLLKCLYFFHEDSNQIYLMTDIKNFQPLRVILPQLTYLQKVSLVQQLVGIICQLGDYHLPIENFSPDMIFCHVNASNEIDVKLSEIVQNFDQWCYTLENDIPCNNLFIRYPFYNAISSIGESVLSMFYSFSWTVLIILHGKCCELISSDSIICNNYREELSNIFNDKQNSKLLSDIKLIFDKCLKRPLEIETVTDVTKIMKEKIKIQ